VGKDITPAFIFLVNKKMAFLKVAFSDSKKSKNILLISYFAERFPHNYRLKIRNHQYA